MVASRFFLPIHPGRFPDENLAAPLKPSFHSCTAKLASRSSPQQPERTEDPSHLERHQLHHNEKSFLWLFRCPPPQPCLPSGFLATSSQDTYPHFQQKLLLSYFALWVGCMWVTCKNNNLTLSGVQLQEVLLCKLLNKRDLCIQYIQTTSQRPNVISMKEAPNIQIIDRWS